MSREQAKSSIRELWDSIKWPNILVIEIPGEEKREKAEKKIMDGYFPKNNEIHQSTDPRSSESPKQD